MNVVREMEKAGLHIPVMIGGATTSELHVALKIAPVYGGPVVWMKDASQNPLVAQRLLSDGGSEDIQHNLNEKYAHMRAEYNSKQQQLSSIDESRKNKLNLWE